MSIDIKKVDNGTLININEATLSGATAIDLKNEAIKLIESGEVNLQLDLSRTDYIDSSGIGKLLFLNKKLKGLGGELSIIKITPILYEFLESLTIDKIININN
ncbi:MAG: STAS domain-containing protein [Spirochaetaceae bacterium]